MFQSVDEVLDYIFEGYGDPNPYTTAQGKLRSLTQGNMEFSKFFSEYLMLSRELKIDNQAQVFNLIERITPRLRRQWDL